MNKDKSKKKATRNTKHEKYITLPVVPELLKAKAQLSRGKIETPKEIEEIDALIFSRGRLNAQFFRGNRKLYVVPAWVERMLNPESKGALSLGHCNSFINTNYRNWTAFGAIDGVNEGIVTDKGLVVPVNNGYGILSGYYSNDQTYFPSRDGEVKQELMEGVLPIIVNNWTIQGTQLQQVVFGIKQTNEEIGSMRFTKKHSSTAGRLVLSLRPFNQEGVSLIHSIQFLPKSLTIIINHEYYLLLKQKPEKIFLGGYHFLGDSALGVSEDSPLGTIEKGESEVAVQCPAGLANMTFLFSEKEEVTELLFNMTKGPFKVTNFTEEMAKAEWKAKLNSGLQVKTGNPEMDRLFYASLANLLLLADPGTITPGPTEYHHFWCRDATFLINALDKTGFHNYAREILQQFIHRQKTDGFYYSHEGEFDSPGEGIWVFTQHFKLTRDRNWLEGVFPSLEKAAQWIIQTRKQTKEGLFSGEDKQLVHGLLPAGYSAEHLGPCNYFYWDNFWGVAGLREAAYCAKILNLESAPTLQKEYQAYLFDLLSSTTKVFEKYGFLPVGPFRKGDSAMIANLVAFHPTGIWDGRNSILRETAEELYRQHTIKGGFFHEVAWNCYGTYLTMHLAQIFHELNDSQRLQEVLKWLLKHQTSPMGWAEGISPQTMSGGMGDCPHGWASADWLLLLRNMFCTETLDGSLKLLSGFPPGNLRKGVEIKGLRTFYGNIDFKARLSKKKLSVKLLMDLSISSLTIATPSPVAKIITDKGEAFKIDEHLVEISDKARKVIIEFE